MAKIKILYGSSCVGKSHIMNNMDNSLFKIEMDDCEYWKYPEIDRKKICIDYFICKIEESINKKNKYIVATCGYLPLPDNNVYTTIENEFNLKIEHILIMNKNLNDYKKKIIKRERQYLMNQLITDYQWRESGKHKYNKIIIN